MKIIARYVLAVLIAFILLIATAGGLHAQSGSISLSSAPTNNSYTITLPPATGGQQHVRVDVAAVYDQSVTIWDVLGMPISGYAVWGNETFCESNGIQLCTTESRRARTLTIDCYDAAGCTARVRSHYSTGFAVSLNVLSPPRTFVLRNTARVAVYTGWVFGGQPGNWTVSAAANDLTWGYEP